MKYLSTIILVLFCEIAISQICVYQDTWRGSVKCTGFSVGATATGSEVVDLSIPAGSSIKKVYLLTYSLFDPDSTLIELNGTKVEWDKFSILTEIYNLFYLEKYKILLSDVTDILDTVVLASTNVKIGNNCGMLTTGCGIFGTHFFVLTQNENESLISFSLQVPDIIVFGDETYQIANLNPINTNNQTAFSIYLDRSLEWIEDGSYVRINDSLIGYIYGEDVQNANYLLSGTQGNFEYRNNVIIGLNDDIPDFQMNHHDALSNISSILLNNSTNFTLGIKHFLPFAPSRANIHLAFPIAYSTPCQPQNVSITPDTTICPNAPLQLSASGGIAYEWLPEVGLSCYDCPNPVFSGDSSRLYTVRIWGSDSCSVVRPVMIHVRKQPKTTFYNQTTTLCGEAQALINWQTAGNNSYSLNDGVFQSTGVFNQVAAGNQLLTVRDAFGCRFDTVVAIDSYLVVDAGLLVSPTSGVAPLEIQIVNQSTNFTDWSWRVNNAFQSKVNPTFQAVTGGNYEIELFAWQNDSTCADTAVQSVFISETGFYIFGSSIVAASSASQNAFLVYTNGKPMIDISMYDAQGRLLKTNTKIQLTEGANAIWNSSEMVAIASEMVFYKIHWQTASNSGELEGKAVVLR